jgi:hypothetical protein
MTVYVCKRRGCRRQGKEFTAMDIADAKLAVGRVRCKACGEVAWYVRPSTPAEAAAGETGGRRWLTRDEIAAAGWEGGQS